MERSLIVTMIQGGKFNHECEKTKTATGMSWIPFRLFHFFPSFLPSLHLKKATNSLFRSDQSVPSLSSFSSFLSFFLLLRDNERRARKWERKGKWQRKEVAQSVVRVKEWEKDAIAEDYYCVRSFLFSFFHLRLQLIFSHGKKFLLRFIPFSIFPQTRAGRDEFECVVEYVMKRGMRRWRKKISDDPECNRKRVKEFFSLSVLTCFDEKRGDTEVVCLTRDMIAVPHNFLPLESCHFSVKKVSTQ